MPISESHSERLLSSMEAGVGPFGNHVRVALLRATQDHPDALKGLGGALGTYGFIKHAQAFVVGAVEKNTLALSDYGYVLERAVLMASSLEVGSCWLGGSFRPGPFGRAISMRGSESVPAVIALGYPAERRPVIDTLIELHHNAGTCRAAWSTRFFDEDDFQVPAEIQALGSAGDLFTAVHLAPRHAIRSRGGLCERRRDCFICFLRGISATRRKIG